MTLRQIPTAEQVRYCRENIDKLVKRRTGEWTGSQVHHLLGMIAETIVCDILDQPRPLQERKADQGADVVINGLRVDVKATLRSKKPLMRYTAAVSELQINNACDAYLFISVDKPKGDYYLVGWITKTDYIEQADYVPAGEPLPNDDVHMVRTSETGTYVLPYRKLNRIYDLEDVQDIGGTE